jgi:hypothetical protein
VVESVSIEMQVKSSMQGLLSDECQSDDAEMGGGPANVGFRVGWGEHTERSGPAKHLGIHCSDGTTTALVIFIILIIS